MLAKLKIDPAKLKIATPRLKLDPALFKLDPATRTRLKARLHAWWEGYPFDPASLPPPPAKEEKPARSAERSAEEPAVPPAAAEPETPHDNGKDEEEEEDATSEEALRKGRRATTWHEPRVLVCEAIWGYGLILPGGVEVPLAWLKPLGLNSKMTLLHIGAGLGGVSRAIAKAFGVWVTAIEDEPAFVEGAMELSTMAGLGKKAPIKLFQPSRPELSAFGKFNAVFAQECLWRMPRRAALLQEIHDVTRKRGHLVLADYFRGKKDAAYAAWQGAERPPEDLLPLGEVRSQLSELGYDVRVAENVTTAHAAQIEHALAGYCQKLRPDAMDKIMAGAVLSELERWNRRLVACRAGGLEICRIDAIRKG